MPVRWVLAVATVSMIAADPTMAYQECAEGHRQAHQSPDAAPAAEDDHRHGEGHSEQPELKAALVVDDLVRLPAIVVGQVNELDVVPGGHGRRPGPSGMSTVIFWPASGPSASSTVTVPHRTVRGVGKERVSAPRGAVGSDGGGRPPSLHRRSGGVKLEAA
jgi:hypothetical protein